MPESGLVSVSGQGGQTPPPLIIEALATIMPFTTVTAFGVTSEMVSNGGNIFAPIAGPDTSCAAEGVKVMRTEPLYRY